MSVDQYGIHLGFLYIRYYGLIIMLGAFGAAILTSWRARKRGMNDEIVWDALVWVILGGIIGARIYHILTPPPSMVAMGLTTQYYLTHPLDAIAIWNGGLGLPGAWLGGGLALYLYTRGRKKSFLDLLDLAAPGVALGQAVGRWGNFFNQELYGAPSNLPWAIFIEPHNRLPAFADFSTYHPTFFYESLWNLVNMALLLWLSYKFIKWLRPGDLILVYLTFYAIGRFLLEFIRLDSAQMGGLNTNQMLMLLVMLVGGALLARRHWRHISPLFSR